ncbi:MAG: phosphatidate cytidylyltransferase [Pseudomonadota bacterium]
MQTSRSASFDDLKLRTVSGVALGLIALGLFWLGGYWSAALLALGAALMVWEMREMVIGAGRGSSLLGIIAMIAAAASVLITEATELRWGFLLVACVGLGLAMAEGPRGRWANIGLLYIALAMMCIDGLRTDDNYGFTAVIWLVTVVIAADVGGYFAGRVIGGPKLWPRVSPKKTWAGLLGGMALAVVVGMIFSAFTSNTFFWKVGLISALVALVSVGGDLLESSIKRHFGVKDSSTLLPGHGGLLDRFDGLAAAAIFASAITFARGQSIFIW